MARNGVVFLRFDLASGTVKSSMKGSICFSNVLFPASLTSNQVYYVRCFACNVLANFIFFVCVCTCYVGAFIRVGACLTSPITTSVESSGFGGFWFNSCSD